MWATEHRLSSWGTRLSSYEACRILRDQGLNPYPLHWQADSYPVCTKGVHRTYILLTNLIYNLCIVLFFTFHRILSLVCFTLEYWLILWAPRILWAFYFIYFFETILNFILFLNFTNCISFAKYLNESATGIHVFPILNPPPSSLPYHPSGSSQCTSPKHPVSCFEPGLATRFMHDIIHVSMPFFQIFPPSPSPTESIRLFYTSVSLLLSRTQGYC